LQPPRFGAGGGAVEPQLAQPELHAYVQVVPLHVADDAFVRLHASPHALQLLVVFSVVHVPPHRLSLHVHTPLLQSGLGCAHGEQFAPIVPQEVADWAEYASHTPPLQQPLGHEVASQTH